MEVSLTSIYVADIFGAVLISVVLAGNLWRLRQRNMENMVLSAMLFCALLNCIVDPIVFTVEGHPGALNRSINLLGNTWLYFSNLFCAALWFSFLTRHACGGVSKTHSRILIFLILLGAIGLVVNLAFPFIFSISDKNVYDRNWGYWGYALVDYAITMDSVIVYFWSRMKNGVLKFFPIWVYFIPLMLGTVAQSIFYGISTIPTGLAIAMAGIFTSLQNELIFRDRLTGLYNRVYLDHHLRTFARRKYSAITGLMLDLNAFKKINDSFGHSVGDAALIKLAEILQFSVGEIGVAIRYAGDEFIILLNTQDDSKVDKYIQVIHDNLNKFNELSGEPYKLSISIGQGRLDLRNYDMDNFINTIDKNMYENKKAYYASHSDFDRRRS